MTTLPEYADYREDRRSSTRAIIFVALALFLIPVILYGVAVALTSGKIPRGTFVAGIDIGGKSPAVAKELLTQQSADRASTPIQLTADDVKTAIQPGAAGLSVDVDGTVERLAKISYNPVSIARSFLQRTDHELTTSVDEGRLAAAVAAVAKKVDRKPLEGSITYQGIEPVAVMPLTGRTLDQQASVELIRRGYATLTPQALELPTKIVPVKSTVADVTQVLETVAKPAVSGPLKLSAGGASSTIGPETIATLLRFNRRADGKLIPRVVPAEVVRIAAPLDQRYQRKPVDASVEIRKGKPVITPSITGRKLDNAKLTAALLPALSKPAPRELKLPFVQAQPKMTTEMVKKLGIREVVGEFTTPHKAGEPRVKNIQRMADIVDGAMVLPGETFSLNGFVGERTAAKGFVKAPMILDGILQPSIGGGVSQFATTMFNAVFFSGLKDVEHKPHSFYISRYPMGREATVSFPAPDLKWKNDSPYGVIVKTAYTSNSITVRFWSTKRYDKVTATNSGKQNIKPFKKLYLEPGPDCIEAKGEDGFFVTVYRHFWKGGKEVRPREKFETAYAPEANFICAKAPPGTPDDQKREKDPDKPSVGDATIPPPVN